MRHIGVDLHKTNFVVCFMSESETTRLETYPRTKTGIARFISHLDKEDEAAVEVTANIYYFYEIIYADGRKFTVDNHRANVCQKLNLLGDNAHIKLALEHKSEFS